MKPVTVVIQTANRPDFLETALASVEGQTGASEIEEVIVSENMGDRRSEAVCSKFRGITVRYLFQDPPVPVTEHSKKLFRLCRTDFVAYLHDDDWWASGHLATGLKALGSCPEAAAYFAAVLFVRSESDREGFIYRHPIMWHVAGRPRYYGTWKLGAEEIFALTWLFTPFHLSSMIARREGLVKTFEEMPEVRPWYADRIIYPHLVRYGPVFYRPSVEVFVRRHPGNWDIGRSSGELCSIHLEGSEKILKLSKDLNLDIHSTWRRILADAPKELQYELIDLFMEIFGKKKVVEYGFSEFLKLRRGLWYVALKRIARQCLPPFIMDIFWQIKVKRCSRKK